jgi:hypothetical protein
MQPAAGRPRQTIDGRASSYGLLGLSILALLRCASLVVAAPNVYSDGSDGAFAPTAATTTIDLDLATIGSWNQPGNGNGVYDPEKWAVVFKYASVNIAAGKTVKFSNHRSGAPVVWLVQPGDITIAGAVDLSGSAYDVSGSLAIAGPGGFAGGRGYRNDIDSGCAGLGPGGGGHSGKQAGDAGYGFSGTGTLGGIMYGNARILPLIGGSGGGGGNRYSGGGGGGAILLACAGTVTVNGTVRAKGGDGSGWNSLVTGIGSGGGIRVIANHVAGAAAGLDATGGGTTGSVGRIRIEANTITLTGSSAPDYTSLKPLDNDTAVLWLPDNAPRIRVVTVGTESVPVDPGNRFNPPGDVVMVTTDLQPVMMQANNVPTTWLVKLRVTQRNGTSSTMDAALVSGDETSSIWQATLTGVPLNDFVVVQARATGL